jgi:hypothetical protein
MRQAALKSWTIGKIRKKLTKKRQRFRVIGTGEDLHLKKDR